jgi:DNA end-binding protein Ku
VLEPEEVASAVPESDKTLSISSFIDWADVDDLYFDKPYYLTPSEPRGGEAFSLLREGMRSKKVAAIAQAILFRHVRNLLIRPYEDGLVATTLSVDYEVRSAQDAFEGTPQIKITGEMLDLARHIIARKLGKIDATKIESYQSQLSRGANISMSIVRALSRFIDSSSSSSRRK